MHCIVLFLLSYLTVNFQLDSKTVHFYTFLHELFPLKKVHIHAEFNENNICFLPYSVQNINIVIIVTIKFSLIFYKVPLITKLTQILFPFHCSC